MTRIEQKMIESNIKICENEAKELIKKIEKSEAKIDKEKQILNELRKEKRAILKEQNKLLSKKNGSKKSTFLTEAQIKETLSSEQLDYDSFVFEHQAVDFSKLTEDDLITLVCE